jgi:hypothetical protein
VAPNWDAIALEDNAAMSVYRPGNIIIDELSTSGNARHPNSPPQWPDANRWKGRMEEWLRLITRENRVARVVLRALERPPSSRRRPAVFLNRATKLDEAWTDGPIAPGPTTNPTKTEAIFTTYSPADSYGVLVGLDPMKYPPSVLLHELVHVLMAIHDLNSTHWRIATWTSSAYPNHNEFCATTIQNMMLSEKGAVLSDGYSRDDPTIDSNPDRPMAPGVFGLRADVSHSGTDLSRFVRRYHRPLVFLQAHLSNLTRAFAPLPVRFNPFRELQRRQHQSAGTRKQGALGGARTPGAIGRFV